jgi:hypothetical protein
LGQPGQLGFGLFTSKPSPALDKKKEEKKNLFI